MRPLIERLAGRPEPFAPGDAQLWTDPLVAPQLLRSHLDPTTDAASRRPETIRREVDWLVEALDLRPGARVLDLGCGPGLYCERLAARGLTVTGVDVSPTSLRHARAAAARAGLEIRYIEGDYRALREVDAYDAAILVYLDFGVLSGPDRRVVLAHVRDALRPGGRLAFDVVTTAATRGACKSWTASRSGGFWRPAPHLVLERQIDYPDEELSLMEYAVLEDRTSPTLYRIWEQRFSREGVTRLLAETGFDVERAGADFTGTPWHPDSEILAVVARRR